MKSNYFIPGGLALAAIAAIAAKYAYEKFYNSETKIDKKIVIKKLIDTRENLYPILYEIAHLVS